MLHTKKLYIKRKNSEIKSCNLYTTKEECNNQFITIKDNGKEVYAPISLVKSNFGLVLKKSGKEYNILEKKLNENKGFPVIFSARKYFETIVPDIYLCVDKTLRFKMETREPVSDFPEHDLFFSFSFFNKRDDKLSYIYIKYDNNTNLLSMYGYKYTGAIAFEQHQKPTFHGIRIGIAIGIFLEQV